MNWRTIGDVPFATFRATLERAGSPLSTIANNAYTAAQPHSALCLAMLRVESQFGTTFRANQESNKNYLNLRPPDGDGYLAFQTPVAGIKAWRERITSETYKDGIYARAITLEELIHVYAPSSDANNEVEYVRSILTDLAKWGVTPEETQMPADLYDVVGLPGVKIALPVPLAHRIIPASQTKQRPGTKRQIPGYWVQHETDNHAAGADAMMHARYLENGVEGRQASWHFTADDGIIVQHIPIDEVTWQAADGGGPGNMSGISCELCVNAGIDIPKSRHNAEALCGGILRALGMSPDRIKRHWDFNAGSADRHHCPDVIMNQGYWSTFVANATKIIEAGSADVPPSYAEPAPITWDEGDVGEIDLDGRPALAFLFEVQVNRKQVVPQVSESDKRQAGPLRKKTTKLRAIGSYRDEHGNAWVVLRDRTRVKRTDVRPLVPLPKAA